MKEGDEVFDIESLQKLFFKCARSMKKIKVSIQDENTLILLEDASKGDIIDLGSIHETDIDKTTITNVVNSIKRDQFNEAVKKETARLERENEWKMKLKEQEFFDRAKQDMHEKEKEIALLQSELKSIAEKTESSIKLKAIEEQQKIEKEHQEVLREKDAEISNIKHKKELSEEKLKEQLKSSETALVSLKEMRTKMSTKML